MVEDGAAVGLDETVRRNDVLQALDKELHRVSALALEDHTATIIQYVALLFAGGLVAASRYPETFVILPLIWNLWLLHMLTKNRRTIKLVTYAEFLERRVNDMLGDPVYRYHSYVNRSARGRPSASASHWAFAVYFVVLNIAAWIGALYILLRHHHLALALIASVACLTTWVSAAFTAAGRKRFVNEIERRLAASDLPYGRVEPPWPVPTFGGAGAGAANHEMEPTTRNG